MRYPGSEKLEVIRLVERSHLPAKQTLDMLGIARTTFYRWYAHYRLDGKDALQDKAPLPARAWNRIPDNIRARLITLALDRPELSPRELAVAFVHCCETFHAPIMTQDVVKLSVPTIQPQDGFRLFRH